MKRLVLIAAASLAALTLVLGPAYAGEPTSTAVSTDAKTINGLTPAPSATTDATNLANDSGPLSPSSQNEPIVSTALTTIAPSSFACGQGLKVTATSNVTATLPGIAGSQPLGAGCWFDVFYPVTSATTLTISACASSGVCGNTDVTDTINQSAAGTPNSVTIYPTWYGVRFLAYPDGSGSGTYHTIGLPPGYLGTVTGYLGTARTVAAGLTFAQTDCGTTINYNSGSNGTFTLPSTITGFCPINVKQMSTGVVTFTAGAGATFLTNINAYTKTGGLNTMVTMENSTGAALWALQGQGQ